MGSYWTTPIPEEARPGWDDMPDEIMGRIMDLRYELMLRDKRLREEQKIIDAFWEKVWLARPRIFRRRLPPI
jgi:hypothetical protein